MRQEKLEETLKAFGQDEPIVQALRQILSDFIADETHAAVASNLTAEARAYNCGRAASLHDLQAFLVDSGFPLEHKSEE
jgi:hypothetical protein